MQPLIERAAATDEAVTALRLVGRDWLLLLVLEAWIVAVLVVLCGVLNPS
jgi:hypothetical protein